jgi:hypothetical protein
MKQKAKRPSLNEAFKRVQRLPKMDRWTSSENVKKPTAVCQTKPTAGAPAPAMKSPGADAGLSFLAE